MIIKKCVCDRCNQEIAIGEESKINISSPNDSVSISSMDFCDDCIGEIIRFAMKANEEEPKEEPAKDSEVVQAINPRGRAPKEFRGKIDQDRHIAIELYKSGKSIGEIAKSVGYTYSTVRKWVRKDERSPEVR